ncbi:MAG TPA: NAD-dependent epimerase/dehydratase family protein [Devosiaceae bacterium]
MARNELVLLTGATGFIGSHLGPALVARGLQLRTSGHTRSSGETLALPIAPRTDFTRLLDGVSAVVHLAGRAHIADRSDVAALQAFRHVNTEGTKALAEAAAKAGVERFIFASSVAVHGSWPGRPLRETDAPAPATPYGISKYEAEIALQALAARTGMAITTLRLPLVYGPGAVGRMGQLVGAIARGLPLPLGSVRNARSLLGIGNLSDLIARLIECPEPIAGQFLVSDGQDVSTPEIVAALAQGMQQRARMPAVPVPVLRAFARISGKAELLDKLIGNLTIDATSIRDALSWQPPIPVHQGLVETGRAHASFRR